MLQIFCDESYQLIDYHLFHYQSVDSIEDGTSLNLISTETNVDAETGSDNMPDDNKQVSNDDSWTDVNLNEEGESPLTINNAKEQQRNVHNMQHLGRGNVDYEGNIHHHIGEEINYYMRRNQNISL